MRKKVLRGYVTEQEAWMTNFISEMDTKITMRYYFNGKTIPSIAENIGQLKLLHVAVENVS